MASRNLLRISLGGKRAVFTIPAPVHHINFFYHLPADKWFQLQKQLGIPCVNGQGSLYQHETANGKLTISDIMSFVCSDSCHEFVCSDVWTNLKHVEQYDGRKSWD